MTSRVEAHPYGALVGDVGPPRVILHIGAPKCGSSSLQGALSARPVFTNDHGVEMSYVSVSQKTALMGNALKVAAAASPYGYSSSSNVPNTEEAEALAARIEKALPPMIDAGVVPILSSEGWSRQAARFAETRIWERIGGGAHVVLFVRAPLDWLNAGWWQWGVWSGTDLSQYLHRAAASVRWAKLAKDWADVRGVEAVHVRLALPDAVQTFFDLIEAPRPDVPNINASLPPALLAFLMRDKDLRPDAHSSAIEFVLNRALKNVAGAPEDPPLWCLDKAALDDSWQRIRFHPRQVAPLLPPGDRPSLKKEPRWFGPDAYGDRAVSDLASFETPEALGALFTWLAGANGREGAELTSTALPEADALIRAEVLTLAKRGNGPLGLLKGRLQKRFG